MYRSRHTGFTLIELLIVIGIMGLLFQLLLPAVQAARESARRTQCGNNMKQIGLAFQLHNESQGYLPSSGWGYRWTGDPDRGYGPEQPGGWGYNVLDYVEQSRIRQMGQGFEGTDRSDARVRALSIPISTFICPSRRRAIAYPSLYEGFGLPAAEAMACGLPVVTSDRSSLPEVVGDAGLLCDPEDRAGLAGELRRLIAEPALARELGERARRRSRRFDWNTTAAQMETIFEQALR